MDLSGFSSSVEQMISDGLEGQTAYLNAPHMMQKMCPSLFLPNSKPERYGNEIFELPHPHLSRGDIAFTLRLTKPHSLYKVLPSLRHYRGNNVGNAPEALVNLNVANYILGGMQIYAGKGEKQWDDTFFDGFGIPHDTEQDDMCYEVFSQCIRPFGVVASDCTGGRGDEITSMVIDGKVGSCNNIWGFERPDATIERFAGKRRTRDSDKVDESYDEARDPVKIIGRVKREAFSGDFRSFNLDAGDALILTLQKIPIHEFQQWRFVMPSCLSKRKECMMFPLQHVHNDGFKPLEYVWQIVPSIRYSSNKSCWDPPGFWHIGFNETPMCRADPDAIDELEDMEKMQTRFHISMRFSPAWCSSMGASENSQFDHRVHDPMREDEDWDKISLPYETHKSAEGSDDVKTYDETDKPAQRFETHHTKLSNLVHGIVADAKSMNQACNEILLGFDDDEELLHGLILFDSSIYSTCEKIRSIDAAIQAHCKDLSFVVDALIKLYNLDNRMVDELDKNAERAIDCLKSLRDICLDPSLPSSAASLALLKIDSRINIGIIDYILQVKKTVESNYMQGNLNGNQWREIMQYTGVANRTIKKSLTLMLYSIMDYEIRSKKIIEKGVALMDSTDQENHLNYIHEILESVEGLRDMLKRQFEP